MSLTFSVTDIQLVKSHVAREHHIPDTPAEAAVNILLPRLVFNEGTSEIEITVEYNIALSTLNEEGNRVPIGDISTAFDVSITASENITASHAENADLNPAQELAVSLSHPYQRLQISRITAGIFPQPVTIPVGLSELMGSD